MSESTETKLLPCPMCGSNNIEAINMCKERSDNKWVVMCIDCFVQTYGGGYTKTEARAAWNRRPAPQWQAKPIDVGVYWAIVDESRSRVIVWIDEDELDGLTVVIIQHQDNPQRMRLDDYIEMFHVTGFCKIELPALPEKGGTDAHCIKTMRYLNG